MSYSKEEIIQQLMNKLGFHESFARPFVEANGRCVYCGEDLLHNKPGYEAAERDHLFPLSKYPELKDKPGNWVLSCSSCNKIKRDITLPIQRDRTIEQVLTILKTKENRDKYIQLIREELREEIAKKYRIWNKVKVILSP